MFSRQDDANGRPAGVEGKAALPGDGRTAYAAKTGLQREAAADSARDIFVEVVDPVARIGPAPLSARGTMHVERIRQARIAERHDRRSKTCSRLAHLPRRALRREHLD